MKKPIKSSQPKLAFDLESLPPAEEWKPRWNEWTVVRIVAGTGYWMHRNGSRELEVDMVLLVPGIGSGKIRSSQIGGLTIRFFTVQPERLGGLLMVEEKQTLNKAMLADDQAKIFSPSSAIAQELRELASGLCDSGPSERLRMLQVFFDALGDHLMPQEMVDAPIAPDARDRLRELFRSTSEMDLVEMSISEIAKIARCTPRHASRLFQEEMGMSFRAKTTQVRLAKACELLATTDSKVVDVAYESGYQSLSLFNLMFTRRFRVSPGRWREEAKRKKGPEVGSMSSRQAPTVSSSWSGASGPKPQASAA